MHVVAVLVRLILSMIYPVIHMSREVTIDMIDSNMNQRFVRYDKNGEEHYNIISAFQKSIVILLFILLCLERK